MKKLRELIRLKYDSKLSNRMIGKALNISPGSVSYYIRAAQAQGLTDWPLPENYQTDEALKNLLEPHPKQLSVTKSKKILPDWPFVQNKLAEKFVTLRLIWEDYVQL